MLAPAEFPDKRSPSPPLQPEDMQDLYDLLGDVVLDALRPIPADFSVIRPDPAHRKVRNLNTGMWRVEGRFFMNTHLIRGACPLETKNTMSSLYCMPNKHGLILPCISQESYLCVCQSV